MKKFDEFVIHIVKKWREEKTIILERGGLGKPIANRKAGDFAEEFVLNKIEKLTPSYSAYFPKGSQTPADIYSVARRDGYWHIMLIQVKSSKIKNNIYELREIEIKQFSELAKFIKTEIANSEMLEDYKKKPILITTGYAGVFSIETNKTFQHRLIKTKSYNLFKVNSSKLNLVDIKPKLVISHELG